MKNRTWLITGVSSGFGLEMTRQLLKKGNRVIGTVRNKEKVSDLMKEYPDTFTCEFLDVTDVPAIHELVNYSFEKFGTIDVIVSNAGYGLFAAAEELSDAEIDHIIATNLTGSIQLIKSALPHMRKQGGGRIIQLSSYGGQVAFPGNSMYHATKWGIEGFCEAVAQEIKPFNIGITLIEPGGARTEFRYGSAKVAKLCWMLQRGWLPATPSAWPPVSLKAQIRNPRRCEWYSVLRRFKAPSPRWKPVLRIMKPRRSLRLPPTFRWVNKSKENTK